MTIMFADTQRLFGGGAVGRRMRGIIFRFRRLAGLKGTRRGEFEQMARDLDLSHPGLYGLLTGRVVSADHVEKHLTELEGSPERAGPRPSPEPEKISARTQDLLPIGPSCC